MTVKPPYTGVDCAYCHAYLSIEGPAKGQSGLVEPESKARNKDRTTLILSLTFCDKKLFHEIRNSTDAKHETCRRRTIKVGVSQKFLPLKSQAADMYCDPNVKIPCPYASAPISADIINRLRVLPGLLKHRGSRDSASLPSACEIEW